MTQNTHTTVAFIGLGTMGFPMAGHLANAGFTVRVYNRTHAKALAWVEQYAGSAHTTPSEAATNADVVLTCVGNDQDLHQVVLGDQGVVHGLKAGAVVVDHTTASADIAQLIAAELAKSSIGFLDAPVSGGQSGAENGVLSIMVGGADEDLAKARAVLDVYSSAIAHMGEVGNGQRAKMVNQICVAGVVQGLAEGLDLAQRSGLDPQLLFETIKHGAAGSWQMANRHETMAKGEFNYGFAVDWMRKDLAIAFVEAEKVGAALPNTRMIDEYYKEIQEIGGGRWDTSSLICRFKDGE